jgi:hypothetical protein
VGAVGLRSRACTGVKQEIPSSDPRTIREILIGVRPSFVSIGAEACGAPKIVIAAL